MLIDTNEKACTTIRQNRRNWDVRCLDLLEFDPEEHPQTYDVDLLSGGLPRLKSMAAVARSGDQPERRLLRAAVLLLTAVRPKVLLLENVPDLVEKDSFSGERSWISAELAHAGYLCHWRVLNAADFGVPQNRRSGFLIAIAETLGAPFSWPEPDDRPPLTVGETLGASMAANGWAGASGWAKRADHLAPALVGGSDRRGGGDLGPRGSKRAWTSLGVNGNSLGDAAPSADFPTDGHPKLTVEQTAMIQCIPRDWSIHGRKTAAYRQVGHAMPPPLATAVGHAVANTLSQ